MTLPQFGIEKIISMDRCGNYEFVMTVVVVELKTQIRSDLNKQPMTYRPRPKKRVHLRDASSTVDNIGIAHRLVRSMVTLENNTGIGRVISIFLKIGEWSGRMTLVLPLSIAAMLVES